jgi:hypothetical protein
LYRLRPNAARGHPEYLLYDPHLRLMYEEAILRVVVFETVVRLRPSDDLAFSRLLQQTTVRSLYHLRTLVLRQLI